MRLRFRSVAVAAILLAVVASLLTAAEAEDDPKPELAEKISFRSPNGKYALRIMYDAALSEQMTGNNEPENDGIFSNSMHGLAIVSLPAKEMVMESAEEKALASRMRSSALR
jgi:hypothetical protein